MAKLTKEHNLAVKNPELSKEWHPTKNGDLTPYNVTPGSSKNVWWQCRKCGREWKAVISNRNRRRGCTVCYKKKQNESDYNKWKIKFNLVEKFIYIHARLPKYNKKNDKERALYYWINDQKRAYKNNKLTQEKIKLLKEIEVII